MDLSAIHSSSDVGEIVCHGATISGMLVFCRLCKPHGFLNQSRTYDVDRGLKDTNCEY